MNRENCLFCLQKNKDILRQQQTLPAALRNKIAHRNNFLLLSLPLFFVFITLQLLQKVNKLQFCILNLSQLKV